MSKDDGSNTSQPLSGFTRGISPLFSYSQERNEQHSDGPKDWYTETPAEKYQKTEAHRLAHKQNDIEKNEPLPPENPHYGLAAYQFLRDKFEEMNPSDPLTVEDGMMLLGLLANIDIQMVFDAPEASYLHAAIDRLNLTTKWNMELLDDHTPKIRRIENKIYEMLDRIRALEGRNG